MHSFPPLNRRLTVYSPNHPEEQAAYERMQLTSFRIAEILMARPRGTMAADIQGYAYWVSAVNGMTEILCTPDHKPNIAPDANIFSVSCFEGQSAEDLDECRIAMEQWLKDPTFVSRDGDKLDAMALYQCGQGPTEFWASFGQPNPVDASQQSTIGASKCVAIDAAAATHADGQSSSSSKEMSQFKASIDLAVLATLVSCTQAHIEDIESGIEEGLYAEADNQDLAVKKAAVEAASRLLPTDANPKVVDAAVAKTDDATAIEFPECPPGGYFIMYGYEKSVDHRDSLSKARERGQELCDEDPLPTTWSIHDADGKFVEEIKRTDGKSLEDLIKDFNPNR